MRRAAITLFGAVIAGVALWFFPLFHVVRNESGETTIDQSEANAAESANVFWNAKLIPALKQAPEAAAVLVALRENDRAARARLGRKVGVGRTSVFVVRGNGKIVAVEKKGVGVAIADESQAPDVILQTGLVFGNVVRDSTGLLDTSAYSDSRLLNEISSELNKITETRVVQALKDTARVGRHIEFAGCVEVPDDASEVGPLAIIPLDVRVE